MIKTAGTTIRYIFRNNFGFNHVEVGKRFFTSVDFKNLLHLNKNIKSIAGHSLRTKLALESVYPEIKYITFLRNPVDRFLSHYNHGIYAKHHNMSLEERIQIPGEWNYLTKFIIGAKDLKDRENPIGRKELGEAKKILDKEYDFVGLVEQFDESLVLMKNQLKIDHLDIRYSREMVTKNKIVTRRDLSKSMLNKLDEINILDIELYNFFKNNIFEKTKTDYGSSFNEDLQNFRLSNQLFKFNKYQLFKNRIGKYVIYRNYFGLKNDYF